MQRKSTGLGTVNWACKGYRFSFNWFTNVFAFSTSQSPQRSINDHIMINQPDCLLFSPVFALRRKNYKWLCQNLELWPGECPSWWSEYFCFHWGELHYWLFAFFCFYHAAATGGSEPREKKIQGRDLQLPKRVTTSSSKSHISHQSRRCAPQPGWGGSWLFGYNLVVTLHLFF